jgi:hypothetical protein
VDDCGLDGRDARLDAGLERTRVVLPDSALAGRIVGIREDALYGLGVCDNGFVRHYRTCNISNGWQNERKSKRFVWNQVQPLQSCLHWHNYIVPRNWDFFLMRLKAIICMLVCRIQKVQHTRSPER